MKKIFIIPGFKQKPTHKQFIWLREFLTEKGFDVLIVPITWHRKTMSDYSSQFEDFYHHHKGKHNYVLGFSYGAVIAFITAEILKPEKVFLCSLSPAFQEDFKDTKRWILAYIGRHRVQDFLTRSGKILASALTIPTVIFYGEKEGKRWPTLKRRAEETALLAHNAKLIIVKNSPHDISFLEYKESIKDQF